MRRFFALVAAGALMLVMAAAPAVAKQGGIPPHDSGDPVEGTTLVCHVPPNDRAGDPFVLRIPNAAVDGHLGHGDGLWEYVEVVPGELFEWTCVFD